MGPTALTVAVSPELAAARAELGILHDLFSTLTERKAAIDAERKRLNGMLAQIDELANDPKHERNFAYLNALIMDAQARADALSPPEATQAPDTDAPPAIASKEPEANAPVAG